MVSFIIFSIGVFIILLVLIFLGMMIYFYLDNKRIRKNMPKADSYEDLNKINYDIQSIERKNVRGWNNGKDRRIRTTSESSEGIRGEESQINNTEQEIIRLQEEIARRERELNGKGEYSR